MGVKSPQVGEMFQIRNAMAHPDEVNLREEIEKIEWFELIKVLKNFKEKDASYRLFVL